MKAKRTKALNAECLSGSFSFGKPMGYRAAREYHFGVDGCLDVCNYASMDISPIKTAQ
jgi:hypothetical protein